MATVTPATMPDTVTITLPIPDRVLSPNARCHWAVKAKATKRMRKCALDACFLALRGVAPDWVNATCQVSWYAKTNRRRDRDNCLASLKAAFDGIVDAGLLQDDCGLTHLPMLMLCDKHSPRVELTLTRED
jgi:crossover junction endodeoxyribonuclease RusA